MPIKKSTIVILARLPLNLDGTPILLHNPTNDRAIILSSSNSDFNLSIVKKYTNRQGFSIEVLQQP
jgi:hypothetical protein